MANAIEFSIKGIDQFSSVLGKAENALGSLKTAVISVAAAYPVAKFAGMIQHSLEMAEAAGQAAQKVGLTTEAYSGLAVAAKVANVEQASLTIALKTLSEGMVDAASGSAKALSALGISGRTAEGQIRPINDVLFDLADSFSKSRDDASKAKAAVDLFGKSGLDMIPFLNQGRESIQEMIKTAERLGLVFTDETAAAADQVNDNMELLKATTQGLVNRVTAQMLPTFESLSNQMLEFAGQEDQARMIAETLTTSLKGLVVVGIAVASTFKAAGQVVGSFFASMGDFDIKDIGKAFVNPIDLLVDSFDKGKKVNFDIFKQGIEDASQTTKKAVEEMQKVWDGGVESTAAAAAKLALSARKSADSMKVHSAVDDEAKKKKDDLRKSIEDLERSLTAQIVNFGQSSEAIKIYELKLKGATEAQLDHLKILQAIHDTQERKKKSDEEAQQMLTSMASPYDTLIAQLTKINELQTMNSLNEEQASELRQRAMKEWQQNSEVITQHKLAVTDFITEAALMAEQQLISLGSWQAQVSQLIVDTANNVAQTVGQTAAAAIIQGQSLAEAMKNILKAVAQAIISSLIQIGVQRMILALIGAAASRTQAAAEMSKSLASVYLNSFASAAAIPFIGWAMAPGVAASNLAQAAAGGVAAMAVGTAMGGAAHGGLDFVPDETTFLLQRGERVVSPRQNKDLTNFLDDGVGSGGGSVTIQSLQIHILENATNAEVFARMDRVQLRETLGQPVIDALNEMSRVGVRPDFATRQL